MKTKIDNELLLLLPSEVKAMNLPPKANEIFCQFSAMADKEGWCYSTIEGLATSLNCSKTTVLVNLKLLENKNIILERVVGKRGTATRFKINLDLLNSTELEKCSTIDSTASCNDSTEYSTEYSTIDSTELKKYIDEVITLKINELKNEIILELRSLFNNDSTASCNDSTIKEKKIKEYKINKNNINIDINKDIEKSTCMYKRRKNDYQFTLEDEVDYNSIVERTNVVGMIPMNKETSNGSCKKIFYFLNGSSLKFNSWVEAQEYAVNNNLNFDECFKKVEVFV
jgi:hypothetical protein